jgi:hypothetical protein
LDIKQSKLTVPVLQTFTPSIFWRIIPTGFPESKLRLPEYADGVFYLDEITPAIRK